MTSDCREILRRETPLISHFEMQFVDNLRFSFARIIFSDNDTCGFVVKLLALSAGLQTTFEGPSPSDKNSCVRPCYRNPTKSREIQTFGEGRRGWITPFHPCRQPTQVSDCRGINSHSPAHNYNRRATINLALSIPAQLTVPYKRV